MRIEGPEVAGGVDGVADAAALEFEIGDFEAPVPLDRGAEHREAVVRGGLDVVRLEGRARGGHEDQPIEPVLLKRVLRRKQVAEVDRVETSPEESDFHRADRGRGVRTRQGPIARAEFQRGIGLAPSAGPGFPSRAPGWWNGRHWGLKIPWPQGRAGSTPAPGTS